MNVNINKICMLLILPVMCLFLLNLSGVCLAQEDPFAGNDAQVDDILAQILPQIWVSDQTQYSDDSTIGDQRIHYAGDGEPVALSYMLSAPEGDAEAAYILFADGIVQPYRLAEPTDEAEGIDAPVHFFRLKKDEMREITILFDPIVGKKGDTVGLYFAVVLTPSYVPPDKEHPGYGNFSTLFNGGGPYGLVMEADAKSTDNEVGYRIPTVVQPIPKSYWMSNQTLEERSAESLRMYTTYLRPPLGDGQFPGYIEAENGMVQFRLLRTGGTSFSYRTTVFVNHEPIAVDGHPDFVFDAEYGMETSVPITLDVSPYPRRNTLYAVTVPVGDLNRIRMGEAAFLQSERLLLINDLAEE